jgi:hypothetical protein
MRRRHVLALAAVSAVWPAARFAAAQDKPANPPGDPAADWGAPTSDYMLTMTFTDARGQRVVMRLAYTPLKQRLEYLDRSGKEQEVVIVDGEAKLLYVLRPGRKQFGKADYARPDYDFRVSSAETKRAFEAAETLDGRPVRRFRVEAPERDGERYVGLAWLTAERVVVKLDGEMIVGKRQRRFIMAASDLALGTPPPEAFRVPADYTEVKPRR